MNGDPFQLPVYKTETVLSSIDALLSVVDPDRTGGQTQRARFFAFLNRVLKVPVPHDPIHERPLLIARPNTQDEEKLLHALMGKGSDADIATVLFEDNEVRLLKARINDALDQIAILYPETYRGITAVVGAFVFARVKGYGGGTSSDAIGVIWCGMHNPAADVDDYIELILHEYMHQCLFIDDLCHRIFRYSMKVLENYPARSAILNRERPLDKAYHSAFVAYILMRHRLHTSGQVLEYLDTTRRCLEATRAQEAGLTAHGAARLGELEAAFARLEREHEAA
ncbi:HEXXH motif-containing putative peptide modification protein [Martelella sp. HB161492]|uniref:aKG-HExxH-type peptide beta-hydroxylase n=1 Tax=Martelella sp. HB161492 TaxID=2720726 RepID=UPI00158FD396|nr:HEXXH motif-containing putative peptide modification protein [Martelella sp. HB161492]